jgi:hypothetical protein
MGVWLVGRPADCVAGSIDVLFNVGVWVEHLNCVNRQTGIQWS